MSLLYGSVRLEFPEGRLFGRETEVASLLDAYNRVRLIGTAEMVLVHGYSGTGKTALLKKLKDVVKDDHNVFSSQSDCEKSTNSPYHAVAECLTQLCEHVLEADDMVILSGELDDDFSRKEREALIHLVPKVSELFGESHRGVTTDFRRLDREAIKSAFFNFCSVLSNSRHPVIVVLDNFQNIDTESLELLEGIILCSSLQNLLVVIAYRENEIMDHRAQSFLQGSDDKAVTVTTNISVGNLGLESTNIYLSKLISQEPQITLPLTKVIHRKTLGNVFYIKGFLQVLEEKNILTFDLATCKWTWNLDRAIAETNVCENVVDSIMGKIASMPNESQRVLKVAACLGVKVDINLLKQVLREEDEEQNQTETKAPDDGVEVQDLLLSLANEGLIERSSKQQYKFSHNRIQEQAYALFSDEQERAMLHLRAGRILKNSSDGDMVEKEKLCEITDHFNHAATYIVDKPRRLELAELNLEAGRSATSISAFIPAARYFKAGLSLLDDDRWAKFYNLALQLCVASAEAEYCCGNFDSSLAMAKEVLKQGRKLQDRIPAQVTIVQALGAQKRFMEALDLGFEVVAALGERFPRFVSSPWLKAEMAKTRRTLRKLTDEELLSLPLLKDSNKTAVMKIVNELSMSALCTSKGSWLPFMVLKVVGMTLKHGICKESACAFVTYGALLCGPLGDMEEGSRFGKLAHQILEKFDAQDLRPRVDFWVYSCINHWRRPITECHDPLLDCYRTGMACGDINSALQSAGLYCITYLYSGLPLEPIESDIRSYCQEMVNYKQETALILAQSTWQFILNLMGRSNDPHVLNGHAMMYEEVLRDTTQTRNRLAAAHLRLMQMMLAYYMGDLQQADDLASTQKKEIAVYHSLYEVVICEFFIGLVSFALLRKCKRRKHLKQAKRAVARLRSWGKTSGNCLHMLALLEAEYAALRKKDTVKQLYDAAIAMAGRSGFLQEKALANERAGVFFLRAGDYDWASHYLSSAHELYLEWGAKAKAEALKAQHSSLLNTPKDQPSTTSHRGRRRFSGRSSSTHRRISTAYRRGSERGSFSRISLSTMSSFRSSGTFSFSNMSSGSETVWKRRPNEGENDDVERDREDVPPDSLDFDGYDEEEEAISD